MWTGRVHRRWWVILALSLILFLSNGFGFYASGFFIKPLQARFGWGRGEVSLAFTLGTLVMGVMSPLAGVLADRGHARLVIGGGSLIAGLAFVSLSATNGLWYWYLLFAAFAAGQAGMLMPPISAVVARWFHDGRGMAMGAATVGIGLGGVVLSPVVAAVIQAVGWRGTFVLMGACIMAVGVPVSLLVFGWKPPSPARVGAGAVRARAMPAERWTARATLRTDTFWLLSSAFMLGYLGQGAVLLHTVPYLQGRGESVGLAGAVLGAVAGLGIVGKLGGGYLSDRLSPRAVTMAALVGDVLGLLGLLLLPGNAGIACYVVVFGISMGSLVTLQPLVIMQFYGPASLGSLMGATTAVSTLGMAVGPAMAGFLYDWSGSYTVAFASFMVGNLVAVALLVATRRPRLPVAARPVPAVGAG